jgi:nicotinamide-nucleotide amidase
MSHAPANSNNAVELFAIGNELLVGQVLDTNSHWLIRAITGAGAHVRRAAMIRDDYGQISDELHAAVRRKPRLIITTGGLGPTDDDMTLRAVSRAFDLPLVEHAEALEWVRQRYLHLATIRPNFDGALNDARRKMALFPRGATPVANPSGAAPAMVLDVAHEVTMISLPGVPSEMKDIYSQTLQPVLAATIGAGGYLERNIVLDLGDESRLAQVLLEAQARHPRVYHKSRGQDYADGRKLTVVLSRGGSDLAEIRAEMRAAEADAVSGLRALGYAVLRVVGDTI